MNQSSILGAVVVGVLSATGAWAEVERLQPDFTFRRVGVPTGAEDKLITIQIDPDAPRLGPVYADPSAPDPDVSPSAPLPTSGYEWFWQTVSPSLNVASSVRFQEAMKLIDTPPSGKSVHAPRLQTLQDIASAHGLSILRETVGTDISPALVLAIIAVESAGRTDAVSSAGAQGLMQLMPATADRFGVSDSMDAGQNIKGGVAYLSWLMQRFDNDPVLALAGYNAGEGNVDQYSGVPPFAETRGYVPKVLAAWQVAKGICQTPPELITDACIFNVNGI